MDKLKKLCGFSLKGWDMTKKVCKFENNTESGCFCESTGFCSLKVPKDVI